MISLRVRSREKGALLLSDPGLAMVIRLDPIRAAPQVGVVMGVNES
jgi:hypothetical protein